MFLGVKISPCTKFTKLLIGLKHVLIFHIILRRYGNVTLMKFRNLEKIRKKYDKIKLDISYLESCLRHWVIPKFLNLKLANHRLRSSKTCDKSKPNFWRMRYINTNLKWVQVQNRIFIGRTETIIEYVEVYGMVLFSARYFKFQKHLL